MESEKIEYTFIELEVLKGINNLRGSEERHLVPGKQLTIDANHINICNYMNYEYKIHRLAAHYPFASQVVFYRDIIHKKELNRSKKEKQIINKIIQQKDFYDYLMSDEFEFIGISILIPKESDDLCFCVIIQNFNSEFFDEVFRKNILEVDENTPATVENIEEILNKFRVQLKLHDFVEVEENHKKVCEAAAKYKTDKKGALDDLVKYVNRLDGHAFFLATKKALDIKALFYKFFKDVSFLNLILSSAHGIGFHFEPEAGYFMITTYSSPADIGHDPNKTTVEKVMVIETFKMAQQKKMTPLKNRNQVTPSKTSTVNSAFATPHEKTGKSFLETPQRPKGLEKQKDFFTPGPISNQHQEKIAATPSPMKATVWSSETSKETYSGGKAEQLRKEICDLCLKYKKGRQCYFFKDKNDDQRLLKYTQNLIKIDFMPSIEGIKRSISEYYDNIHFSSCIIDEKDPDIVSKAIESSKVCSDDFRPYENFAKSFSICPCVAYENGKYYILFVFAELIHQRLYSLSLMSEINRYREENKLPQLRIYSNLFNFAMQGIETMLAHKKIIPFDNRQRQILSKDGAISSDAIVQKYEDITDKNHTHVILEKILESPANVARLQSDYNTIGAFLSQDPEIKSTFYVAIYLEKR